MSDNNSVLVSVIMPNYNTPVEFIEEAVESILNQTYSNFELIIIDDCSTDNSIDYIEALSDNRVVVIKNDKNRGPAYSRNRGLDIAKGKYIVIMDSDDISLPNRIECLVSYMKKHDEIMICSAWARVFGDIDEEFIYRPKKMSSEFIKISLLFGCSCIMVPIIKKTALDKYMLRYTNHYIAAQDYKLWVDCAEYGEFAILPQVLYLRRMQKKSITMAKGDLQQQFRWKIIQEQLAKLHYTLSEEKKKYYNCIYSPRKVYDLRTKEIIKELITANKKYRVYKQRSFKKYLWERWAVISTYGLKNEKGVKKKFYVLLNMPINRFHYMIKTISSLLFEKIRDNNTRKKQ